MQWGMKEVATVNYHTKQPKYHNVDLYNAIKIFWVFEKYPKDSGTAGFAPKKIDYPKESQEECGLPQRYVGVMRFSPKMPRSEVVCPKDLQE